MNAASTRAEMLHGVKTPCSSHTSTRGNCNLVLLVPFFLLEWVQRGQEMQKRDEIEMPSRNPETAIKNNKRVHVLALYGRTLSPSWF